VLAYADDMVLCALLLWELQILIDLMSQHVHSIDMMRNTRKIVCMVLNLKEKNKFIANKFPCLKLNGVNIDYVQHFIYLRHIITNNNV